MQLKNGRLSTPIGTRNYMLQAVVSGLKPLKVTTVFNSNLQSADDWKGRCRTTPLMSTTSASSQVQPLHKIKSTVSQAAVSAEIVRGSELSTEISTSCSTRTRKTARKTMTPCTAARLASVSLLRSLLPRTPRMLIMLNQLILVIRHVTTDHPTKVFDVRNSERMR
jgi:hypothetical protein